MTQVILTVSRHWFDGGRLGLSEAQKTAREQMTRHLTYDWLPRKVLDATSVARGADEHSEVMEVFVRQYGEYDYRTVDFRIEIFLDSWLSDPQDAVADMTDVQDQIQESFKLFLLGVDGWFDDIAMPGATFRVSCHRREGVTGACQVANLKTGCIQPLGAGQPIGAA